MKHKGSFRERFKPKFYQPKPATKPMVEEYYYPMGRHIYENLLEDTYKCVYCGLVRVDFEEEWTGSARYMPSWLKYVTVPKFYQVQPDGSQKEFLSDYFLNCVRRRMK